MENALSFLKSIVPESFNISHYREFVVVMVVGVMLVSVLARAIFGQRSTLQHAVSSSMAILCIYVVNVVIYSTGVKLDFILSPLPFVRIEGDYLILFNLLSSPFNEICIHVLDMVILAFLMNLLDSVLPKGKKLISWYFFRFLSVVMAICLQYIVNLVLGILVPAGFAAIAPTILLIILIAAVLLGSLKLLVGGLLAFLDPIMGVLYTFFFSNIVGKQLSKAILTTTLLTALVALLNYLQISAVYIASAALIAYLPLLIIVLVLWYVVGHIL
jgi:hypothetical protein